MAQTDESTAKVGGRRGRFPWVCLSIVILAIVAALAFVNWWPPHPRTRMVLKSWVKDAAGLHEGAPVRLAGDEIGYVRTVEAHPDNREYPGYIEMAITAPYELRIPQDSLAAVKAAGFLQSSYVDIDASKATGPAIANGGTLPSASKEVLTPERTLELMESLKRMQEKMDKRSPERESKAKGSSRPEDAR